MKFVPCVEKCCVQFGARFDASLQIGGNRMTDRHAH